MPNPLQPDLAPLPESPLDRWLELPGLAQFAVELALVLAFAWVAAKGAGWLLEKVGRRVGRVPSKSVRRTAAIVMPGVIATGGTAIALHTLDLTPPVHAVLIDTLQTALVFLLAYAAFTSVDDLVGLVGRRVEARADTTVELQLLARNMAIMGILVALAVAVLGVWGIDVGPLVASAGLVGAAVALAAGDTLANLFGGVSVVLDRYYKVGDFLVLENGERGEVVNIGLRSTQLRTPTDVLITVPNSVMAGQRVTNQSAPFPAFRVHVPVGVAYGSDADQVRDVLLAVARSNEDISTEPEPQVWFVGFGDSALLFEVLVYCPDPSLMNRIVSDLNFAIYRAFDEAEIRIPFPQRDVHLKWSPPDDGTAP